MKGKSLSSRRVPPAGCVYKCISYVCYSKKKDKEKMDLHFALTLSKIQHSKDHGLEIKKKIKTML